MLSSSNVNKLASEVGFNSIFSKLQMFNKRVNIQALVIETIPPKDTSSVHIKNTGDNILPVSTLMFRMYKIGIWLTPSNRHPQPFQDIIAYIYMCVCIFAHEKHHMKGFREKKVLSCRPSLSLLYKHMCRHVKQDQFSKRILPWKWNMDLYLNCFHPIQWLDLSRRNTSVHVFINEYTQTHSYRSFIFSY